MPLKSLTKSMRRLVSFPLWKCEQNRLWGIIKILLDMRNMLTNAACCLQMLLFALISLKTYNFWGKSLISVILGTLLSISSKYVFHWDL